MAFTVSLTVDGSIKDQYGDNDIYEVGGNGVLAVKRAGHNMQKIYSTSGWAYLSADSDHEPGTPKGDRGARIY
jgi:hypothetical protein